MIAYVPLHVWPVPMHIYLCFCLRCQGDDDEDLPPIERPVMDQQEIAETGEGLVANRFTVSESFKKLESGEGKVNHLAGHTEIQDK